MGRNTNTGKAAEEFITPALEKGQYDFKYQKRIDNGNLNKKNLFLDYYLQTSSTRIGVEIKWQQSNGTAEQKIPYTIITLLNLIENDILDKAYIVLGGTDSSKADRTDGWTLRKYYLGGQLDSFINYKDRVYIVGIEEFASKAMRKNL